MNQPLTEEEKDLLIRLSRKIVDLRMGVPAIFFLEMHKPLNFLGSQVMAFLDPIVTTFFSVNEYKQIQQILEKRDSIEYFIREIENQESEFLAQEKARKKEKETKDNGKKSRGIKKYFSHRLW
jgi:hypothetical protein